MLEGQLEAAQIARSCALPTRSSMRSAFTVVLLIASNTPAPLIDGRSSARSVLRARSRRVLLDVGCGDGNVLVAAARLAQLRLVSSETQLQGFVGACSRPRLSRSGGSRGERSCTPLPVPSIARAGARAVVFEHDLARLSQHRAYVQATSSTPTSMPADSLMACNDARLSHSRQASGYPTHAPAHTSAGECAAPCLRASACSSARRLRATQVPTSTEPPGNAIGNGPGAGRAILGMVRLYEHPISAQPTSSPPPPSLPSPPPPMAEDATAAARAATEERADALCALTDVPSTRQGEFEAGFASAAAKLHPRIRRALVDDEVDTSDCM